MLRGLLRLGVLPGLRGGAVPGRGEGKVYEVARNVGEVSGRPSTGTTIATTTTTTKCHVFVETPRDLGGRRREEIYLRTAAVFNF